MQLCLVCDNYNYDVELKLCLICFKDTRVETHGYSFTDHIPDHALGEDKMDPAKTSIPSADDVKMEPHKKLIATELTEKEQCIGNTTTTESNNNTTMMMTNEEKILQNISAKKPDIDHASMGRMLFEGDTASNFELSLALSQMSEEDQQKVFQYKHQLVVKRDLKNQRIAERTSHFLNPLDCYNQSLNCIEVGDVHQFKWLVTESVYGAKIIKECISPIFDNFSVENCIFSFIETGVNSLMISNGTEILMKCIDINQAEMVDFIINDEQKDESTQRVYIDMIIYCIETNKDDVLNRFMNHESIDFNMTSSKGQAIITYLTKHGKISQIQEMLLLKPDMNLNASNGKEQNILHIAIENSQWEIFETVLKNSDFNCTLDVNKKDIFGVTPLMTSCKNGLLAFANTLLDMGEDNLIELNPHGFDFCNNTALTYCLSNCKEGHDELTFLELARRLICLGVKGVNGSYEPESHTEPPLICTLKKGQVMLAELILQQEDVDVNVTSNGDNPLFMASKQGYLEIAKQIVSKPEVKITRGIRNHDPLSIACKNGFNYIVKWLLDSGKFDYYYVYRNNLPHEGSPLELTLARENVECAILLLDKFGIFAYEIKPAVLNTETFVVKTLLQIAVEKNMINVVEKMISVGIDTQPNVEQNNLLHIACENGFTEMVVLLSPYFDLSQPNEKGYIPFLIAIENRKTDTACKLLDMYPEKKDWTNLVLEDKHIIYYCLENRNIELLQVLLEHGADPAAKTSIYAGPLLLCAEKHITIYNYEREVEILLKYGADPNICSGNGTSALMKAAVEGNIALMEVLFQGGADANLQNSYGKTVLMFAIQYNQLDVVRYLCEKKSSGADIDFNLLDKDGKTAFEIVRNKGQYAKLIGPHTDGVPAWTYENL